MAGEQPKETMLPVFKCNRVVREDGIIEDDRFCFVCPKCAKTNTHSASDGHRSSHCKCWRDSGGYYIEEAPVTYRSC